MNLKLITRQSLANNVADRWKGAFFYEEYWRDGANEKEVENIYKQLLTLTNPINADEVDKIIGNRTWTWPVCCMCNKDTEAVIIMKARSTIRVCQDCLQNALAKFDERVS